MNVSRGSIADIRAAEEADPDGIQFRRDILSKHSLAPPEIDAYMELKDLLHAWAERHKPLVLMEVSDSVSQRRRETGCAIEFYSFLTGVSIEVLFPFANRLLTDFDSAENGVEFDGP